MTKKQKIWLSIFLAMFLIPEILWGGVRWIIFRAYFPLKIFKNFDFGLTGDINNNLLGSLIAMAQFFGLLGFTVILSKLKTNSLLKTIVLIFLIALLFFSGILALAGFYYLFNVPQIG